MVEIVNQRHSACITFMSAIKCQAVTEMRALEGILHKVEDFLFQTAKGEDVDVHEVQKVLKDASPKFQALQLRSKS